MLIERFETPGLAHYSYAVGDGSGKEIAIIDPRRDIETYLDFAQQKNLRIIHVLETHIHADYASGATALATKAGATLWASAYDEGEMYRVSYPAKQLRNGDSISVGQIKLTAL